MLSPDIISIVSLSLKVAIVAVAVTLPLAICVAYVLARWHFAGKTLVSAICHVPLVLPPVVTGYLLLIAFGPQAPLGKALEQLFGLELGFRWTGAALAAGIMAFPLMIRPMRVAFESLDQSSLEMSETLGASRFTRFRTISLPLAMPGIIAGIVLGFAKALGEFGATITFVSNIPEETRTISLAVYTFLQSPSGDEHAITLILLALGISFVAIYLSEAISNRIGRARN